MPHKDPIKRLIYQKEYREKNKEKKAIYKKEYYQTPRGKMKSHIDRWKKQGIHVEDMEILYKWFLEATHCENCKKEFVDGKYNNLTKCVDHDHNVEFNNFRNILCISCNSNQNNLNTSGTANIYTDKRYGNWFYSRTIDKIRHQKYFKTKQEAIAYKKAYEFTHIYSHQLD